LKEVASSPAWLKVAEVARRTGMSPRWVQDRIYDGQLPAKKFGGVWQIRVADLEAFIAALPDQKRAGPR
jgi:excisionase family DNA binding protein